MMDEKLGTLEIADDGTAGQLQFGGSGAGEDRSVQQSGRLARSSGPPGLGARRRQYRLGELVSGASAGLDPAQAAVRRGGIAKYVAICLF